MASFIHTRFRRLAKEGSWIVIGQITTVAGALVLVRVLTEYLSPAEYGELALGLTMAQLTNQVVFGGIGQGIGRYYSIAAEAHDLDGYFRSSRRLLGYATVAVLSIGLVLMGGLAWLGYSQWIGVATAALVYSVLSAYNSSLNGIQNAARQRAIVALHCGLDAWLKILLAVLVMLWLGTSSTAVVISYALATALVTSSQLIFLRRTFTHKPDPTDRHSSWPSRIWAYSWPFSTWGIFTWAQQVSDRWALEGFVSTAEVGKYVVLSQLGYAPITMLTGMAVAFLGPILYQRSGDATRAQRNAAVHQLTWNITYFSLAITSIGVFFISITHEWIFSYFVASEYHGSSFLLPWVALAGGVFAAGQTLSIKLMCELKTTAIASAKIITALAAICLNIAGAALAGINGVVGALVVFSVLYFAWMILLARKANPVNSKLAA